MASWADAEGLLSSLIGPTPLAIIITVICVVTIPLLLHLLVFRSPSSTNLPCFLLLGPSGAGKTTYLTLLERGQHADTRPSQTPLTVEVSLPVTTTTHSSKYRSVNDPSNLIHKKLLLADTPGHGKLRNHALDSLISPQNVKGVIFMVDAADLSIGSSQADNEPLRQAAEYLYDILLLLQRRHTNSKSSKAIDDISVLIAANKLDLFTALPASLVKIALEAEITKIRVSRNKGLLDSGVCMDGFEGGEDKEWLGDSELDGGFEFTQMQEMKLSIKVIGGNVKGPDGADIQQWWDWIGNLL